MAMTEEFPLDIEGTGVIKHMTFNMVVTWDSPETQEKCDDKFVELLKIDSEKSKGPIIVLKDGIVEWCQQTLENSVYGRCKSLESGDSVGGPELIFGSEADRACFVLKWL